MSNSSHHEILIYDIHDTATLFIALPPKALAAACPLVSLISFDGSQLGEKSRKEFRWVMSKKYMAMLKYTELKLKATMIHFHLGEVSAWAYNK